MWLQLDLLLMKSGPPMQESSLYIHLSHLQKVGGYYADFGFPTGSQFVPKFSPTMHRGYTIRFASRSRFSAPLLNHARILWRKYYNAIKEYALPLVTGKI